jgi:MinD superfamily P-loop ATPase
VRDEAKRIAQEQNKSLIIVDGPPGIGCPVVASLTGADMAVIVTEPTVSGKHDLGRIIELLEKMKLKAGVIINKADLNPEMRDEIKKFIREKGLELIAELPYDKTFTDAIMEGKTVVEYDNGKIKQLLQQSWEKVMKMIQREK